MGIVLAIANQKGGVGKTTIAMNLAGAFSAAGYCVLVADADAQSSALRWAGVGDEPLPFKVIGAAPLGRNIGREVARHAEENDIVIVDCPPNIDDQTTARILLIADVTLIPLDSSPLDVWSSEGMTRLVEQTKQVQPNGKYAMLFTKSNVRTTLHAQMRELLLESNVHLLTSHVKHREAYRLTAALGRTVQSAKGVPRLKEARDEITRLAEELVDFIGAEGAES